MKLCKYCKKPNPQFKTVNGHFCDKECSDSWVDEKIMQGDDCCFGCGLIVEEGMLEVCEFCGEAYCDDCFASPLDDLDPDMCKGCAREDHIDAIMIGE